MKGNKELRIWNSPLNCSYVMIYERGQLEYTKPLSVFWERSNFKIKDRKKSKYCKQNESFFNILYLLEIKNVQPAYLHPHPRVQPGTAE